MSSYDVDLNALFEKLFKHYLEPEFHDVLSKEKDYIIERKTTEFLDEYLASLIQGHINIEASSKLNIYIKEILEDEWFLQWPLVRWAYASRILNGVAYRKNKKKAIEILLPLAQEGCPNALYDIGYCYRYGEGLERNYEKAICLWILSCNWGYYLAYEKLEWEHHLKEYKKLGDELRFFFLLQLILGFVREYGLKVENGVINTEGLNETNSKTLRKFLYEYNSLKKIIVEKAWLRETADIFWAEDDNLYKINF